jgi:hypothetical protein
MIGVRSLRAVFERRPRVRSIATWARTLNRKRVALVLTLWFVGLLSVLAYVFVISAGSFTRWPSYNAYFDMYAEGFRAGHLHLLQEPPPALLAKQNPLDHTNVSMWLWDASLYRGHYYMYWGPAPAVLLAVGKTLLGVHTTVGDEVTAFLFTSGRAIFGLLLLDLSVRRLFPKTPVWLVVAGALVFALGNPALFVLGRSGPYEVAIVSAQCFLVAGLFFALRAVLASSNVAAACALASSSWALAIGSRGSLLPAVALLCVATLGALRFATPSLRLGRPFIALALPPALMMLGLALYNYARFDSFTELGMNHQMSMRHFDTTALYAPSNVYSYLVRRLFYGCGFPFVTAPWYIGQAGLARWLALIPGYYMDEPMAGVLNSCPWVFLGGLAVLVRRKVGNQSIAPRVFCAVALAITSTVTLLPALGLWFATMRYLLDVMSGATLLAAIGSFALWERITEKAAWVRLLVATPLLALATYSVALGLLLGIQGYSGHFHRHNPDLYKAMQQKMSLCRR